MQCLNIKNKEVAALLKEYTDILGSENAAYYVLSENNGYGLDRAPNGAPSKLFSDLLSHYNGDNSRAIQAKAQVYSDSFKNWFGDWQSEDKSNVSKVVDENGEPLVVYHGSSATFDTFDENYQRRGQFDFGFYFTPNQELTQRYASEGNALYATFLNLREEDTIPQTRHDDWVFRDGVIVKSNYETNEQAREIVVRRPNQIKSIDNQGTFSTQDNNIYNQPSASPTPVGTGRNQQLANILQELYPDIEIGELNDPNLRGQAQVEGNMAGRVLLNAVLENQDTLPHEYAHHYIAWFRNAPLVQRGIKRFGSEEALVQAIGENSVRALKWYNRFFNWIKGLFSSKQAVLNRLTNDFLSGTEQDTSTRGLLREIHNQTINAGTTSIPTEVTKLFDKLVKVTNNRINTLEHSAVRNPKVLSNLESLTNRFNQLDAFRSVLEFVSYMRSDVEDSLNTLKEYTKQFMDYEKGLIPDNPITPTQLDAIRKGTIGFYNNLYIDLQNALDDPEVRAYIEEAYPNSTVYEDTISQLKNAANRYAELARYFNRLSDKVARHYLLQEAERQGSESLEEFRKKLDEGDEDISTLSRYAGQTQYSSSELVRLTLNKLSEGKYRVHDAALAKGKELLALQEKISKSDLDLFFEKDKKGNRTGNFISDLNFGEHEQNYKNHMAKVLNNMKVTVPEGISFGDIPSILNSEQLKRWNREKNKWDAENSERRFIPAYYELMNDLSEEARAKKDDINMQIEDLLEKTMDSDGYYHREDLSNEEYAKLVALENQKANLSSPFYMDGTAKTGKDKEIADEIREYNKKLRDNVKYSANMKKFNEAKAKAKATLSPEKYKLWLERNTRDKISEQFYEDIKKLSSVLVKSQDQLSYEAVRSQLIRMYTFDGKVDPTTMPSDVKEFINTLDELIAQEAFANRQKGVKSRVMEIAEWQVDPNFYKEMEIAFSKSQAEWDAWVAQNGHYDRNGNVVPASFWKKLVPKKELRDKYIETVPNSTWMEVDKTSPFYNKNFDESYGVARVPKRSKYDNSSNFKKIKGNLKVLYDALLQTMAEANKEYPFMKNTNRRQMPQMEGGTYRRIAGADSVLKGLGHVLMEGVTVTEQDEQYNVTRALEPDGSPVRLVPTRYMKKLDNPNTITDDIIGSVILYYKTAMNYKEMTKLAPEMESIVDFASRQDYRKSDGSIISGASSNTYAKLREMVDDFVYGMSDNPRLMRMTLFGKKLEVSVDKALGNLARFTRVNGLGNNLYVIMTGLFTNKIQSRLDAIGGIYYDNESLAKASLEIQSSYGSAIAGIGNANNKNKALCVLEWSGSVRDFNNTFSRLNQSRWTRALQQHFFYGGYAMADYITKGKMALAIMMNYKFVPSKGKFMNKMQFYATYTDKKKAKADWKTLTTTAYDAFEVKGNALSIKEEYKPYFDEVTQTRIRNTIKQVGSRIDSQLTDLDKNYVSSNSFWKLIFMYRNFLLINFQTKFVTPRQYDYSTGMWNEAQFKGAFNYIYRHYINKDKINTLKEMYRNYDQLDELERRLAKRTLYEVLFCTLGLYFISLLFQGLAEDDKDDWLKNTLALLSLRTAIESRGNIVPLEALNMMSSPTAAWGTVESLITAIQTLFDEPNDIIRSGNYKGLRRWQRSLIKLTPFRAIYEAKDPQYKLQYYDNLISIF